MLNTFEDIAPYEDQFCTKAKKLGAVFYTWQVQWEEVSWYIRGVEMNLPRGHVRVDWVGQIVGSNRDQEDVEDKGWGRLRNAKNMEEVECYCDAGCEVL